MLPVCRVCRTTARGSSEDISECAQPEQLAEKTSRGSIAASSHSLVRFVCFICERVNVGERGSKVQSRLELRESDRYLAGTG